VLCADAVGATAELEKKRAAINATNETTCNENLRGFMTDSLPVGRFGGLGVFDSGIPYRTSFAMLSRID
jgi:hypothetical protein